MVSSTFDHSHHQNNQNYQESYSYYNTNDSWYIKSRVCSSAGLLSFVTRAVCIILARAVGVVTAGVVFIASYTVLYTFTGMWTPEFITGTVPFKKENILFCIILNVNGFSLGDI